MTEFNRNRRIEYLRRLTEGDEVYVNDYVLRALIFSLTAEDAVNFFDLRFIQDSTIRHWLVEKICKDAEKELQEFHSEFANALLEIIGQKSFSKRESCAFALGSLCTHMPQPLQHTIISKFLSSRYSKLRLRGYKYLRNSWMPEFENQVVSNWERFKEEKAAWLIIENASDEMLLTNFKEYVPHLNPYQRSRFFIRLFPINAESIEELITIDAISYTYVRAKLHKPLSSADAKNILEENKDDERVGLLFWSLSQMELFDVIADFHMVHGSPDPDRLPVIL